MQARFAAVAMIGFLLFAPAARADDAADQRKAQYEALGKSRADAEAAVKQAHDFFDAGTMTWQKVTQEIDAARMNADQALVQAMDAEQRKPEDQRDQKLIESDRTDRLGLESRGQQYAASRLELESAFHEANNKASASGELLRCLEE